MLRRKFLHSFGSFALLGAILPSSSFLYAQNLDENSAPQEQLLVLFRLLTSYSDLEEQLNLKYFNAFKRLYPNFEQQLKTLFAGLKTYPTAAAIQAYARSQGLNDFVQTLMNAWYTGTVGPNPQGDFQMVAYQHALMYRPTSDGIPVPTYCFNGPLWFTALPPGIHQEPTVAMTF